MMRKIQLALFGIVILGFGGAALWAGAKLKADSEPAPQKPVEKGKTKSPDPKTPIPAPAREIKEPTSAPPDKPADPPAPAETKFQIPPRQDSAPPNAPSAEPVKTLGPPSRAAKDPLSPDSKAESLPAPTPPPASVSGNFDSASPAPSPQIPEAKPNSPVSPPAPIMPAPTTPPPSFPDAPKNAFVPLPDPDFPSGTLPPPAPLPSPIPTSVEGSKPNNIFRALATTPTSAPTTKDVASIPVTCPWTLQVKIVGGRTLLEARNDDKVQLRISCQMLDLQAPNGTIRARGDVKLNGSDLNGSCEMLTIAWQHESVLLEGKVQLTCPKEGQEIELAAERLSVKLTGAKSAKLNVNEP